MINTVVIAGLVEPIVIEIKMTLTVSRVNVNGGQLAQSKNERSNYSITYHNKERFSFDYANTLDTVPVL